MDRHDELLAAMAASGLSVPGMPAPAIDEAPEERAVDEGLMEELAGVGLIAEASPQPAVAEEIAVEETPAEEGITLADEGLAGGETADGIADAELAALLAETEIAAEPVAPVNEEALVEEVALTLERQEEAYASQESAPLVTLPVKVAAPVAAPASRTSGLIKREARFAPGAAGAYVATVLGDPAFEARVDALPKKVKEKAANLVDHLKKSRPLSVFTQAAVNIMQAEGGFTNERLVRAFTTEATKRGMTSGYSIGTARSQAGQQVALFTRLGIGRVNEGKIVPNGESALWQALSGQAA